MSENTVDKAQLARDMLEYYDLKITLNVLEAKINGALLSLEKSQEVGYLRAQVATVSG